MITTRRLAIVGWSLIGSAALVAIATIGWMRWTNALADRRAHDARTELLLTWSSVDRTPPRPTPAEGESFALLSIPRLREQVWQTPILHGVGDDELQSGVGHYPNSALPGEPGNFALAGHRTAHGEPFTAFDQLKSGDEIIVRIGEDQFVYTLVRDAVVDPSDTWVVSQRAADQLLASTNDAIITLVTCTPKWSTSQRWVWWGVLSQTLRHATTYR
jgi:sortase A